MQKRGCLLVWVHIVLVTIPLMDTRERKSSFGGSGRCVVGGRRDAVSCSHDCVRLSIRVVKSGCRLKLCVSPTIAAAWPVSLSED